MFGDPFNQQLGYSIGLSQRDYLNQQAYWAAQQQQAYQSECLGSLQNQAQSNPDERLLVLLTEE